MKKFLITGMGRSGTKYMTAVLTRLGVDVKHEEDNPGGDGIVSWKHAFLDYAPEVFIMQYRDPVNCIASFQTANMDSFHFMYKRIGRPPENCSLIYRCMHAWLLWNIRLEACNNVDFSFWVEDIELKIFGILTAIGHKVELEKIREVIDFVPKTLHSRAKKYNPLTWEDLFNEDKRLAADIEFYAIKKGYKNG